MLSIRKRTIHCLQIGVSTERSDSSETASPTARPACENFFTKQPNSFRKKAFFSSEADGMKTAFCQRMSVRSVICTRKITMRSTRRLSPFSTFFAKEWCEPAFHQPHEFSKQPERPLA